MTINLTIIGAGPGGYVAAIRAANLGINVTLIEKHNLGGTCLNYGCIPSKIMKNSSDLFSKILNSGQYGIKINGNIDFDIKALMLRKEKIIETQRTGIGSLLKKNGVNLINGRGYIKDKGIIIVELDDGNEIKVKFDKLIIATGTKPFEMNDFPFDHNRILSSDDLLDLETIPSSITIVGGGVIGCEFAFILSSMGSQVTIVEAMNRLLPIPSVDENCSKILLREMKKKKIKVLIDRVVTKAKENNQKLFLTIEKSPFSTDDKDVPQVIHETDKLAVCIGRKPIISNLGLDNIGLKTDHHGWIKVNDCMETDVKGIYAIGDILGPSKVMLAHVASHEGMVAVDNISGKVNHMSYDSIPGAIFTTPEIANVGLSEKQASDQGMDAAGYSVNFRILGKAQAIGEIAGEAKIIIENKTGIILGVHIIGPHATDLIAEGTLAVTKNLTIHDIIHTIHAHPTLAEIMSEVALKASGNPLHG